LMHGYSGVIHNRRSTVLHDHGAWRSRPRDLDGAYLYKPVRNGTFARSRSAAGCRARRGGARAIRGPGDLTPGIDGPGRGAAGDRTSASFAAGQSSLPRRAQSAPRG
jgi:hypothetical protein